MTKQGLKEIKVSSINLVSVQVKSALLFYNVLKYKYRYNWNQQQIITPCHQ